ncbi:T7SS effector LXG polymorphic toxin [Bacillus sp. SJS]|uniref:T7SS effector LXG polymorphic toxin n=1 Tax=Bacillus sp. SJS TaxID=1423321 RepID=UPI0004DD4AA6|nr:T7SS effector LXG polymorphic toxin [Bacillus sp. SJS]KZZ84135.1 hypothetical protein AS29_013155 [Bacillus sp. SJS]
MKVLDVNALNDGIDATVKSIDEHLKEIKGFAESLSSFLSIEDSFKGETANAIRSFYQESHIPFIVYYGRVLTEYRRNLKSMSDAIQAVEPESNGYIIENFLEKDVTEGLNKVKDVTISLTDEVNAVIDQIKDIASINHIKDGELIDEVKAMKNRSEETIKSLQKMDSEQSKTLDETIENVTVLQSYTKEIKSKFSSNKLSVSNFKIPQLQEVKSYQKLQEKISEKDWTALEVMDTGILFDATAPVSSAGSAFGVISEGIALGSTAWSVKKGFEITSKNNTYYIRGGTAIGLKTDELRKLPKNYVESQAKIGNLTNVAEQVRPATAIKQALKSKLGWFGIGVSTVENINKNVQANESNAKITGDAIVDVGVGAVTLAAGATSVALVTALGAPVLGAAAIGFGISVGASYLLDGVKFGKEETSISDGIKSGVEKGIKTIAGWFK